MRKADKIDLARYTLKVDNKIGTDIFKTGNGLIVARGDYIQLN